MSERHEFELFLQGEGVHEITLIRVLQDGSVADVLAAARAIGLKVPDGVSVYLEDEEDELSLGAVVASTSVRHRSRVHVNRCKKVNATVTFNGVEKSESFPPSTTMKRVKQWAVGPKGFNMSEVDAAEHVLQLTGSAERPDEDVHIGTLVRGSHCSVTFDLVPKIRVEG